MGCMLMSPAFHAGLLKLKPIRASRMSRYRYPEFTLIIQLTGLSEEEIIHIAHQSNNE